MIVSTFKSQVQIANLSSRYEIANCSLNIPVDISWTTRSPDAILNSLSFHSLPQAYSCYIFFPRIQFCHPPNCTFQKPGSYYWHSLSLYVQSITKFCWFYLINDLKYIGFSTNSLLPLVFLAFDGLLIGVSHPHSPTHILSASTPLSYFLFYFQNDLLKM